MINFIIKFAVHKTLGLKYSYFLNDILCSLRLADCYIDAIVGGIDVIAEAETLKKLIAAPFSKQPLNLIVHKIGKTLMLDNCAYLKNVSFSNFEKELIYIEFRVILIFLFSVRLYESNCWHFFCGRFS